MEKELQFCLELISRAGETAMEVYRQQDFAVDEKAPRDFVTAADRLVNTLLVDALRTQFPNDLVVGEESGHTGAVDADRAWFVDPVDGTADFVQRNGEWSVMIGLAVAGRAQLGVVLEPATGLLFWGARSMGAHCRYGTTQRQLTVRDIDDATQAVAINSRNHPDPTILGVLQRLGITRSWEHGSVGCKVARIAEQRADVYMNLSGKCHMWDTCGPEVILREAGGDLVDNLGNPLVYAGDTTRVKAPFVAATSRLLPAVLRALDDTTV